MSVKPGSGIVSNSTGVHVSAGNGLSANSSFLTVGQGDGITVGPTTVGVDSTVARTTTSINPGNGLTGGGTLATTRTLAVGQGDGITVGPTTVGVDSSVVRKVGNQIIDGTKSFTGLIESYATSTLWGEKAKPAFQVSNVALNNSISWLWQARNITDDIVAGVQIINDGNRMRHYTSNTEYVQFTGNIIDDIHISDNIVKTTGPQIVYGPKTFNVPITGNITGTAAKLTTPRTLTIGSTGKVFDGSANVSWNLAEIGAAPVAGSGSITTVGTITSGAWNAGSVEATGYVRTAVGSAASPSFTFTTDTNTGMFSAGADAIGFSTNGTLAAMISSAGDLRLYNTTGTFYTNIATQPTANRTLSLPDGSVTLVTGTMVPTTTAINSSNGITGGGTLSSSRNLSIVAGNGLIANTTGVHVVAGNGLIANSTYLGVGAGSGISVSGDTVAVDSTVVRTTGVQTITGSKIFSGTVYIGASSGVDNVVATIGYVDGLESKISTYLRTWNAIGSYAFLYYSGATYINTGDTTNGSNLSASNANGASGGSSLSGVWRLMGNTSLTNNASSTSLFVRLS